MTRYFVRSGCDGDWMVWDRTKHGPATLHGKQLSRLSRNAADAALARLGRRTNEPLAILRETWQISFEGNVVECRDELDAKRVARDLIKRGHKVSAHAMDGDTPVYSIERHEIWTWLME